MKITDSPDEIHKSCHLNIIVKKMFWKFFTLLYNLANSYNLEEGTAKIFCKTLICKDLGHSSCETS